MSNRDSQRSWLHALLRERSRDGGRLSQVELQDIAERELGHPFPKYTARISELRDELFPKEAVFCERMPSDAEVWEYWIGPMTPAAKDRYLENRGKKSVSLLTVTFEELVDLAYEATDGEADLSDSSITRLRAFGKQIESHLCNGHNLGESVRRALRFA